ncbi:type I-G CRISPR-associated protein, Cas3-extension family [Xanthobacter sediminis]
MARPRKSTPVADAPVPLPEPELAHRLGGLEPDNLLAFLALLGLMRALEAEDAAPGANLRLHPRVSWDVEKPPLRPRLHLAAPLTRAALAARAAAGVARLAAAHEFGKHADLDYSRGDARALLLEVRDTAGAGARERADLLAALMSEAAVKEAKDAGTAPVAPTPLCLLFGQGHQHFLERLARVPQLAAPPPRGRGKAAVTLSPADCLAEALFQPWRREDPTSSFRWDPKEDVRYALMAGDPTDPAYKTATQHGANRLAAVGLAALTVAPQVRGGRVRPAVLGGASGPEGFAFAWPIHAEAVSLSGLRALLAHPALHEAKGLAVLGVSQVMRARRIPNGKFMNFTRAQPVTAGR